MKILRKNIDQNIILNKEDVFKTDLGWQDNAQEMEREILETIINPTQNFETVRYIHKPYTSDSGILQSDIWFKFWFVSGSTYVQDYEPTGLSARENALMLKQTTESFFRLEFYKTPNGELPNRTNRRLVFAKNLSLPLGEKYYYTTLNDYIFKPVFMGSNYRNKENMYLFWFQDDTALNEVTLTGDTFYMAAKFFNAEDGSITDFTNKPFINGFTEPSYTSRIGTTSNPILFYERGIPSPTQEVDEESDMYYCVKLKRNDIEYGYVYDIGCNNCLFSGGTVNSIGLTPTPTITPTMTITPTQTITPTIGDVTPTPTITPTLTPTQTITPTTPTYAYWSFATSGSCSNAVFTIVKNLNTIVIAGSYSGTQNGYFEVQEGDYLTITTLAGSQGAPDGPCSDPYVRYDSNQIEEDSALGLYPPAEATISVTVSSADISYGITISGTIGGGVYIVPV